jgi:glycosyl transferase family 25
MHSFFINLDRRPDRRIQFEGECVRMGIECERLPAVTHPVPALGCLLSHLTIIKLARDRGYEKVCIFEDDFEFLVSKEEFGNVLISLPPNADVVMLGYYLVDTAPVNDTFGKVLAATTTSGYIVNRAFYNTLIRTLEEAVSLFKANLRTYDVIARYSIDQYWRRIQPTANWFYTLKRVGKQRAGFSDLVGGHVEYAY